MLWLESQTFFFAETFGGTRSTKGEKKGLFAPTILNIITYALTIL